MSESQGNKTRVAVAALSVSAAAIFGLLGHEGFRAKPYIPTQGDVPTIGYGSTVYEDGSRVTLADPPIDEKRALQIVRNHQNKDEAAFRASLPDVKLTQGEYDLYLDFTYQFGIGNWRSSSMRRYLMREEYVRACNALPAWRRQDGRDCSLPRNWGPKGCKGVWTRQLERQAKCLGEQQ